LWKEKTKLALPKEGGEGRERGKKSMVNSRKKKQIDVNGQKEEKGPRASM